MTLDEKQRWMKTRQQGLAPVYPRSYNVLGKGAENFHPRPWASGAALTIEDATRRRSRNKPAAKRSREIRRGLAKEQLPPAAIAASEELRERDHIEQIREAWTKEFLDGLRDGRTGKRARKAVCA